MPTLPPDVNAMELDDLLRNGTHLYDEDGFECYYADGKFVYEYYGFASPQQMDTVALGNLFRQEPARYENTQWLIPPCCHGFGTVEELAVFVAFAGIEHS